MLKRNNTIHISWGGEAVICGGANKSHRLLRGQGLRQRRQARLFNYDLNIKLKTRLRGVRIMISALDFFFFTVISCFAQLIESTRQRNWERIAVCGRETQLERLLAKSTYTLMTLDYTFC